MDLHLNSNNGPHGTRTPMKIAYTVSERQGRSYWTRIGVGYINRDGSINIRLDAVPVTGSIQLRDWTPREPHPDPEVPRPRASGLRLDDSMPPPSMMSANDGIARTADIPF